MLKFLDEWLCGQRAWAINLFCLLCIPVLGFIDYRLGPEFSFSLFYAAPIALAAWYGGFATSAGLAVLAAVVWYVAFIATGQQYSQEWILVWNALIRLGFFLIIVGLLDALKSRLKVEEQLADTDPLTGLANRRVFYEQVEKEAARARRHRQPLTITYIDLDNFKFINDTRGHDTGDQVLINIAHNFQEMIRRSDLGARLGGDEFAGLFPMADYEAAASVIGKLHEHLIACMEDNAWPITFSIGAITFDKVTESSRDMIKAVDDLMYAVKKAGKNNIAHAKWDGERLVLEQAVADSGSSQSARVR